MSETGRHATLAPAALFARYEHLKGRPVRDPERVHAVLRIEQIRARCLKSDAELAEAARDLLRALGVRPSGVRYALLRELGLLEDLQSAGLSEQLLYAAQTILHSSGRRRLEDVTPDDVKRHLARGAEWLRRGRTRPENERIILSLMFRAYYAWRDRTVQA